MRWREIDGFINEMGGKGGVRGAHAEAVLKISRIATPHSQRENATLLPLGGRNGAEDADLLMSRRLQRHTSYL